MIPPIVLGAVAILLLALRVIAATGRRSFLRAALVGLLLAAAASSVDAPPPVLGESGSTWVTAWGRTPLSTTVTTASTSVQATVPSQISNQTLRLITWTTIGGSQVKVKFTNRFSTSPLVISAAHVALRQSGGTIAAGSDRTLTFGGGPSVTIAAGAEAWSDAAVLDVPAHADLAISMYLPGTFTPKTFHPTGLKTSYLSPRATSLRPRRCRCRRAAPRRRRRRCCSLPKCRCWPPSTPQTIVAIGDSITDGACSNTEHERQLAGLAVGAAARPRRRHARLHRQRGHRLESIRGVGRRRAFRSASTSRRAGVAPGEVGGLLRGYQRHLIRARDFRHDHRGLPGRDRAGTRGGRSASSASRSSRLSIRRRTSATMRSHARL